MHCTYIVTYIVSLEVATESMRRSAAVWLLKTREKHKIPISVMDDITKDVQELFLSALDNIQRQLKSLYPDDDLIQSGLSQHLSSSNPLLDLFDGLKTQQQQINYFTRELNMIVSIILCRSLIIIVYIVFDYKVPVKKVLGTERVPRHHGRKRRLVEKEHVMVYVPLLNTLERLLCDDGILAEVYTYVSAA